MQKRRWQAQRCTSGARWDPSQLALRGRHIYSYECAGAFMAFHGVAECHGSAGTYGKGPCMLGCTSGIVFFMLLCGPKAPFSGISAQMGQCRVCRCRWTAPFGW